MKTAVLWIDPAHPDEEKIAAAGRVIRQGGLVAFPTETVYGLGGDALNAGASVKIYEAKGRPSDNPLIVHIADMEALPLVAAEIPETAYRLADAFWPGPLTMIFRKTAAVPDRTSGGLDTVAVRMPDHPTALALIRAGGGYIAAPSANASGRPSPTSAEHVRQDLDGRIEMILDSGPTQIGLESTIVDLTEEVPVILRPGFINRRMIEDVAGEVRIDPGITESGEAEHVRPKAPGMRYRHYAPRAPLTIVEGRREDVADRINELTAGAEAEGKKAGILASEETAGSYRHGRVYRVGSLESEETIARHLFEVLRQCDADGEDVLYSESFDTPDMGMAIMNRLLKAAGHQIIHV